MTTLNVFKGLTLDKFQRDAYISLNKSENPESVIISAPTGSGKTLIVEFAIEIALKEGKSIIYTSPIKALSNQKFREFSKYYGSENVGIITGDITLNRHAPIKIMTTEILRNMLYLDPDDPEIMDLMFVVFDEIHYINDPQRGVIWEESLILLPRQIPIVLLSATIPNANEIKDWLEKIKGKSFHLIEHFERPIPLHNYFFDGLLHKFTGKIKIHPDQLRKLHRQLIIQRKTGNKQSKLVFGNEIFSPVDIIKKLDHNFYPTIYFIFSRKACEKAAKYVVSSEIHLITPSELKLINTHLSKFDSDLNSIENLQQIRTELNLIRKGVAYHHAGCIPIIKEIVETLFAESLIKVLFATETFAMGLNLPAKTVIFHGIQKYDGERFRMMTSGEFHQMSGRAGRRGIDLHGNAIVILDADIDEEEIESLITGDPEPLESQFKLNYNAICNLLQNREPKDIKKLLESSFKEYTADKIRNQKNVGLQKSLDLLDKKIAKGIDCPKGLGNAEAVSYVENYQFITQEHRSLKMRMHLDFNTPYKREIMNKIWHEIIPIGRLVNVVAHNQTEQLLGIIIRAHKNDIMRFDNFFPVDVLINKGNIMRLLPHEYEYYELKYPVEHLPTLPISNNDSKIDQIFKECTININEGLSLNTIKQPIIAEDAIRGKLKSYNIFILNNSVTIDLDENIRKLTQHPCHSCEYLVEHKKKQRFIANLKRKHDRIQNRIIESENLSYDAFKRMADVLKDLNFVDSTGALNEKGFLLANIHHENDILIAEAINRGLLDDLYPEELVGLFAFFSVGRRNRGGMEKVPKVRNKKLKKIFKSIERYERKLKFFESKRNVPLININRSYSMRFVELAQLWSEGNDLNSLSRLTTISEGDIVNSLRRILNLMTQTQIILQKLNFGLYNETMYEAIISIRRSHVVSMLENDSNKESFLGDISINKPDDDFSIPVLR